MSILDVKGFALHPSVIDGDHSIGQDAVDVREDQPDGLGNFIVAVVQGRGLSMESRVKGTSRKS